MKTRMSFQLPFDLRSLVRGVIVQNQVDLQIGRNLRIYGLEELDPFLVPVPLRAMGQYFSLQIIQGRKQRQGSMPIVVMGARGNVSLAQGKSWLATFQGLTLALFVAAKPREARNAKRNTNNCVL